MEQHRSSSSSPSRSPLPHVPSTIHPHSPPTLSLVSSPARPSSRRLATITSFWPEESVERIALHLALQTFRASGPLSVAPALVTLFQVCTTWYSISRSEILWQSLTRSIWKRERLIGESWRGCYLKLHKTAFNFLTGKSQHSELEYEASSDSNNGGGSTCRCLAASFKYLASGFSDGAVRVFDTRTKDCVCTLRPVHESRLGPHSRAIVGILLDDARIIFASLDGSVFIGNVEGAECRRSYFGDTVNDGTLVDFSGSHTWWVGLYAGVPGRAIRIWNATTEEVIYNGGNMTDLDAVRGWYLLADQVDRVGRIRISSDRLLVIATRSRLSIMDLETHGVALNVEEVGGFLFGTVDVQDDRLIVILANGIARICIVESMEDVTTFRVETGRDPTGRVHGAVNSLHAIVAIAGRIHIWNATSGEYLYALEGEYDDLYDLVATDDYLACCVSDNGIHFWDFTPG